MLDMARHTIFGYDDPVHRDWLFWTVLTISVLGVGAGIVVEGARWQNIFQISGGTLIGGLVLGSIREVVRGYREPTGRSD